MGKLRTGLVTVLVRPSEAADAIATDRIDTQALVLVTVGIDFLLTLLLLPLARAAVLLAMQSHPEISHSMSWLIMAFSVVFGTLVNLVLALIVALLAYLVTAVSSNDHANYRRLFEVVLVGSSPLILARCLRTVAQALHWKEAPLLTIPGLLAALHFRVAPWIQSTNLSPLELWSLGLFAYLYGRVSGLGRLPSYGIVAALWLLLQIVSSRLLGK